MSAEKVGADSSEPIFQFVTLRDPQLVPKSALPRIDVLATAEHAGEDDTPVRSFADAPSVAVTLNDDLIRAADEDEYDIASVVRSSGLRVARNSSKKASEATPAQETDSSYSWLREHVNSQDYKNERGRCARGLLQAMIDPLESANRPDLMRILQIYALIDWAVAERPVSAALTRRLADDALVLVPGDLDSYQMPGRSAHLPDANVDDSTGRHSLGEAEPSGDRTRRIAAAISRYSSPLRTRHGLRAVRSQPLEPADTAASTRGSDQPSVEEVRDLANRYESAADELVAVMGQAEFLGELQTLELPSWRLTASRRARLSASARAVLAAQGLDGAVSIVDAVEELRARAADLYASMVERSAEDIRMSNRRALTDALAKMKGWPTHSDINLAAPTPILARPPRLGDLEVVRQELVGYEKGELAHVENVMPREFRQRQHRVVDLSESEEIEVDEREEETTQENSTTSRSELSNEMSRAANQDTQLQAGGSISARYGPWVEASANVGYTSSNSSSTSERRAQSYATEMTERAANTIRQRVMRTQRRLTRRQVTEANIHRFDNPSEKPVVGYYRWLNKRYRAQVFNLGQRVLLDLVIPDPALNYRYASALGAGVNVDIDAPPAFVNPGTSDELRPEHVTPLTWKGLAARFRAGSVTPPPPELLASTVAAQSTSPPELRLLPEKGSSASASGAWALAAPVQAFANETMTIPAGYRPLVWSAAIVQRTSTMHVITNPPTGHIPHGPYEIPGPSILGLLAVGTSVSHFTAGSPQIGGYFTPGATAPAGMPALSAPDEEDLPIPVGLAAIGPVVMSAHVVAVSVRSRAVLDQWQMETFAALQTAHEAWDAEFRAAIRGAEIGRGVAIQGANPLSNAKTITTELKRTAIVLLGGPSAESTVAAKPGDPTTETAPSIDPVVARAIGPEIMFWEQAFEWENMTYLFYPYFWTGRGDWAQQSRLDDTDPAFADFLQAGAARITIPVRPGYVRPASLRLGIKLPKAWTSDPAPTPNSEPWLSIAEETRIRQNPPTGRPVGTPWTLVLPTTLVCLDEDPADLFDLQDRRDLPAPIDEPADPV